MAKCDTCGNEVRADQLVDGICANCRRDRVLNSVFTRAYGRPIGPDGQPVAVPEPEPEVEEEPSEPDILVTTETHLDIPIAERLDVISAECVVGVNIFRDIGSAVRDIVGGRNKGLQKVLRNARKDVLRELRIEAAELGADAVIAVDLDYSEISGGGKSMLFLVASGTAVKLGHAEIGSAAAE